MPKAHTSTASPYPAVGAAAEPAATPTTRPLASTVRPFASRCALSDTCAPSSTSGARYHSEVTSGVSGPPAVGRWRASPKSARRSTPPLSISRLVCFRSRCAMPSGSSAASAPSSCLHRHLTCPSAKGVAMCSMSRPRSKSTSSMARNNGAAARASTEAGAVSTSCARTMFGWRSWWSSAHSRSTSSGTPPNSFSSACAAAAPLGFGPAGCWAEEKVLKAFMATACPDSRSRARKTRAMAPAPRSPSRSYTSIVRSRRTSDGAMGSRTARVYRRSKR
mmetsp:Transcript_33243/g.82785  ORF Transcript_33243/g.82785 Transcript_33243/m.82785 type:complete len:277 (+) Transcript_33243:702-1532(+)